MTDKFEMLPGSTLRKARQKIAIAFAVIVFSTSHAVSAESQTPQSKSAGNSNCRVESIDYKGWKAQQVSNRWVQLTFVPQNGGRLMQVTFNGHDYLFVNPKLAGQITPPNENQWVNYGGDKIWLLPEGDDDEQHWRGGSDLIDAGEFSFRKLSDQKGCGLELTGPPDPHSGVQISRTVRLEPDSPHIAFLATMKNISGHTLEWSMQSVSQYDTGNGDQSRRNPDIWGFTQANPSSGYLNRYHVRDGPVGNPSASIREDGLFAVHYSHVAAEFWIDSPNGWLAVVDGSSRYAMVERFQYEERKTYPGKASVIFWTNGSHLRFNDEGEASVTDGNNGPAPFYMEAELNSPICRLRPDESCQLETDWYPTRAAAEFHGTTDAGIITTPLRAQALENGKVKLSGSFGVFFAGKLVAHLYNDHGSNIANVPVANVTPTELVVLDQEISSPGKPARVSLHLEDQSGLDRGAFQEIPIQTGKRVE
ncbi:MAG TPA: hypothetical protein VLK33_15620 [Terriglobales bacterium]|nr:hypothetical protein [Terriglobales bacterium]